MTLRLDGSTPKTNTGNIATRTAPLPEEVAVAEPIVEAGQPADTSKAATTHGEVTISGAVDLEAVHLPGGEVPLPPAEAEDELKAGAAFAKVGDATHNKSLNRAANVANAPQILIHTVQAAGALIEDPSKALAQLQKLGDDPLGTAMAAKEAFDEVKENVDTLVDAGKVVGEQGKRAIGNVAEHGLTRGIAQTGKDVAKDVKTLGGELKENLSATTGAGLNNLPKVIAKETAEKVEARATKAMIRELGNQIPELAPKGVVGKVTAKVGKAIEPATKLVERGLATANRVADRVADAGVKLLGEGKLGKTIKAGIEVFNPAAKVPQTMLQGAVRSGTETGLKAATETAVKLAETKGVKLTGTALRAVETAGARAAAKEGAKIGAKVAGKGLARFAPGVNIAIAGYDAVHAAKVWRDPKSTGWQKGMATATAVFSAAAATNIPIVSQAGAVLSIGTSLLENVKPSTLLNAAAKLKFW